jgi:hypothetical protein
MGTQGKGSEQTQHPAGSRHPVGQSARRGTTAQREAKACKMTMNKAIIRRCEQLTVCSRFAAAYLLVVK